MKLSNENINSKRNEIDRDIRMLECIENMHKRMEYKVSCEDPNISYISIDGLRLIFENGVYKGRYIFEEEVDERASKNKDEENKKVLKIENLVREFFVDQDMYVSVREWGVTGYTYTNITINIGGYEPRDKYVFIFGSIDYISSLPKDKFFNILAGASWV